MSTANFHYNEADALLVEFNHRLFNSFQVISGAISVCGKADTPGSMQAALNALDGKLRALAQLHRLVASANLSEDLESHCQALCGLLLKAFGREDVAVRLKMDDVELRQDYAMKIALLVVELVTNVLKHSLWEGCGGTIWIALRGDEDEVELAVWDSRGAPAAPNSTSRIAHLLAQSMQGHAFVADRNGFEACVRIPLRAQRPSAQARRNRQTVGYWAPVVVEPLAPLSSEGFGRLRFRSVEFDQ